MMDPPSRNGSPCGSPSRVDENTMEALKEFLQYLTRTIEFLCNRYSKSSSFVSENPDLRTSLSDGIPPDSHNMLPTIGEAPGTHLCGEMSTFQPASISNEGNFGQMKYWSSEGCALEQKKKGCRSFTFDEKRVNAALFENEAVIHGTTLDANAQGHFLEREREDALKTFLEDMKRTIESWSVRHNVLVQGKSIPTKEGADMVDVVETMRTTEAMCSQPHPSDSNVRENDLVNLGSDDASFPCDKDQDVALTEFCGQRNQREACEMPHSNHEFQGCTTKTEGISFVQPEDGKERWNTLLPQAEQGKTDAVTLSSPKVWNETACELPQHNHEAPTQGAADVQEHVKEAEVEFLSASVMHLEVDPVQSKDRVDDGEMDVEITSRNDGGEVGNLVTPKVDQAEPENRSRDWIPKNLLPEMAIPPNDNDAVREVAIQPYCRRVDVVDSPDWLPKGWITELKTRGNGQSAGSKDKYYYDPVSKRRFRSKKEVFCFLETGKLGRYKKRPKFPSARKLLGPELPSARQANDSCEPRNANGSQTSGMTSTSIHQQNTSSTSVPSNITSVTAPMGLYGNLFMPYRPGQPSEWLVYESLASLPLPAFDHFRYAEYNLSKSMGNRGPVTRPWFSSNLEFSRRPFVDRGDLGQAVEKRKNGQSFELSTTIPEAQPRKSATAAKKLSKKAST